LKSGFHWESAFVQEIPNPTSSKINNLYLVSVPCQFNANSDCDGTWPERAVPSRVGNLNLMSLLNTISYHSSAFGPMPSYLLHSFSPPPQQQPRLHSVRWSLLPLFSLPATYCRKWASHLPSIALTSSHSNDQQSSNCNHCPQPTVIRSLVVGNLHRRAKSSYAPRLQHLRNLTESTKKHGPSWW